MCGISYRLGGTVEFRSNFSRGCISELSDNLRERDRSNFKSENKSPAREHVLVCKYSNSSSQTLKVTSLILSAT